MDTGPISFHWRDPFAVAGFRSAVSLHGHTYHSRELLGFIPRYAQVVPGVRQAMQRQCAKYQQIHGVEIDFNRGWWTPPLSAKGAYEIERAQITQLGIEAMVSLSDHDNMEAPFELHASGRQVPLSVEWSVPLNPSFIHLGVHNLPVDRAPQLFPAMRAYTADPEPAALAGILAELHAIPEVLTVFNHPLWDEPEIGAGLHRSMMFTFLAQHGSRVHALELNGLRPWSENSEVCRLAASAGVPAIS